MNCFRCGKETDLTICEDTNDAICQGCLDVIDAIVLDCAVELGADAGKDITLGGWQNERPQPGESWLGMLERLKKETNGKKPNRNV